MAIKTARYDKTKAKPAAKPAVKLAAKTAAPVVKPKPKPAVAKTVKVVGTKTELPKSDEFLKELIEKTYPQQHQIKYRKQGNTFDFTASVRNMPTGCGLGVIYSMLSLILEIPKNEFLSQLKEISTNQGISAYICTLGDSYYNYEKKLLDLGFVEIACYHNKLHGGTSTQKLYLIDLTKID